MQKFIVELIGVFTKKDLPEDYEKFVDYKATIEDRDVDDKVKIAVLRVKDTTSYHILFLDSYDSMDEIDKEVDEKLDGKIYNFNIRRILEGHINA
ncbi:MAG: hypothetical protein BZ136_07250 [Methanosphaera sp. rholeuAM74]|nr:MAG: hypothetical protein BZ136_07250 [Methanosphaera sp. rholeuAM74]